MLVPGTPHDAKLLWILWAELLTSYLLLLRTKAIAFCPSVRPSVSHSGGSVKNGAS